jgi:antitoxin ParD1/3/4
MNVSLTPRLEQFVEKKVRTGLYQTASEVVREGLRLLQERDQLEKARLAELRSLVAVGIDQIEAGSTTPFDDAALKRIRRRGRSKLAALRKHT